MLSGFFRYVEQHLVETYLSPFLSAFAKAIFAGGGKILTDAADKAVAAAEANGGSGGDKFKAAFDAVVTTLKSEGVPLIENSVRLAIEAAVAKMNAA